VDEGKPAKDQAEEEKEEASPGYDSPQYRIYRENQTSLDAQKLEVFKMYHAFLIAMSTAIPGGSLLALKEFECIRYHWILVVAWAFFAVTIITSCLELYYSQKAYERQIEIEGIQFARQDYATQHVNCYSNACRFLLKTTTTAFVCSLLSIVVFFSINFFFMRPVDVRKEAKPAACGEANPEKHPVCGNCPSDKHDEQAQQQPLRPGQCS
jgi:hypothetical protein